MIQAIIAVQTVVTGEELSSAMAFIVFTQSLGPAIALTLCQLIFYSSLETQLPRQAPNADAAEIIRVGATAFRGVVAEEDLRGVLVAYSNSISRAFYLVAALAAACGLVLWGMGWVNLKAKKPEEVDAEQAKTEERIENTSETRSQTNSEAHSGADTVVNNDIKTTPKDEPLKEGL